MFVIRKEVNNAFANEKTNEFYRTMLQRIRANLSKFVIHKDDVVLLEEISNLHSKAVTYDITTKRAVGIFISLGIIAGYDFDRLPAIQTILQSEKLTPTFKAEVLLHSLKQYESKLDKVTLT